jgi:hypothetical protein
VETVELEQHPYGPEATCDEREAMANRVFTFDERLVFMHELPVQSPFSVNLMFDRIELLARNWDRFAYVVDLTEAKRPDAETRVVLKARVGRLIPRVAHVAVVVGDNLLMRAMARLFAYNMGLASVGIHSTRAEAIEEARCAMGR